MPKEVTKEMKKLQDILGDVNFEDMMTDFRESIEHLYNAKVEEYMALAPKTDAALITILNMTPRALVSVLLNMHKIQRSMMGSNETPLKQMYTDAVELFNMTDEDMEAQREYLVATRH